MHGVTKILVVLAALASLFLSALVMSYSVNASRVVAGYQQERDRSIAAETALASANAKESEEQIRLMRRIDSLMSEIATRDQALVSLQTETGELRRRSESAEADRDAFGNKIAQFGETIKTMSSLLNSFRGEVVSLRDQELRYRKREIDLVDRINDQDSEIEVLTQTMRALQEELAAAQQTLDGSVGGQVVSQGGGGVVPAIQGRVIGTMDDEATGSTLVHINLGSEDQIRPQMKLYFSRGNKYLGSAVVVSADLQDAVARIEQLNGDVQIQSQDVVRTQILQ